MDGAFVASHLLRESAALVELVDALLEDANAPAEEIVVGGDDSGGDGGESAPVVVVVGLLAGFVKVDGAVGDFVHPLDVAFDDGLVEGGLVEEDGFADGDGAEGPLDLEPGLGAFLGVVVEERFSVCP